jgi:hypothetical protein
MGLQADREILFDFRLGAYASAVFFAGALVGYRLLRRWVCRDMANY